jgi:chromosomal replication initiation ATPase DnaA
MYKFVKMKEDKQVQTLLKYISDGIKLYGVKDLNDSLIKTLFQKTDKSAVVEFILDMICKDFDITRYKLIKSAQRGHSQKARQIAYCLLYFEIGLTLRAIGNIFGKYVRSVSIVIENYRLLKTNLKQDKEFLDLYANYSERVKEFLNIDKK